MSSGLSDQFPEWQTTIKKLLVSAWRDAPFSNTEKVDQWLQNFSGQITDIQTEQTHALHLLAHLIFFGKREIGECLRVLFQEQLLYPFAQSLKGRGANPHEIWTEFNNYCLNHVRFIGVGSPSESGNFLYRFRQINNLSVKLFPSIEDTVQFQKMKDQSEPLVTLKPSNLKELIFIDDFCGSGTQAPRKVKKTVKLLKQAHPHVRVSYFMLFSTQDGLEALQKAKLFDRIHAVVIFDPDYKTFCDESHCFKRQQPSVNKATSQKIMHHYGSKLQPSDSLGFGGCELLISFEHNTPNNTLPVIWSSDPNIPWHPIFPRTEKIE